MLRRGSLRDEVGIDAGEHLLGLGASLLGRLEGALLALHRRAHRVQAGSRGIGGAAQLRQPHIVLGDERALRRDVGVEGVELGARPDDVAAGGGGGILRTADAISPVAASHVLTTLILFVVVYGIVFAMGIYYINRLIESGPRPSEPRDEENLPNRPLAAAADRGREVFGGGGGS